MTFPPGKPTPPAASLIVEAIRRCEGYTELGMWDAAWKDLEDLPMEHQRDFGVLSWRIQILAGLGEHQQASAIGRALLEGHPAELGTLLLTTECLLALKDHAGAQALLLEKLAWHPTNPDVWLALARVEALLGNSTAVRDCIEQYVSVYPEGKGVLLDVPELAYLWE